MNYCGRVWYTLKLSQLNQLSSNKPVEVVIFVTTRKITIRIRDAHGLACI